MPTILGIDDNPDNLTTISALLKNLMPGCSVITARSGREGIEKALEELPDTILLDVNMPGMDGFETCRRLKADERTRSIPVIMITAVRTDAKSRIDGLEIGADAFLSKPIDESELVSQLKVALRIRAAEATLRVERDSLESMVQERTRALQTSADQLAAAMELARLAIWEYDVATGVFTFDDHFYDLLGTTAPLEGGYRMPADAYARTFLPPDEQSVFADEVRKAVRATDSNYHAYLEHRLICRNGQVHHAAVRFSITKDENGRTVKAHGTNQDITERKKAEEQLVAGHAQLEKTLQGTLHVIQKMTETRDAYTAGHQKRVAELSVAIAHQMGLPEDSCVPLIDMAARIHDIGKIAIPAEILSRPGKLSDTEFALIKAHPQAGYDILKQAELPYPVPETVLQHHERYDGTGYPAGLSGDDILPEASILAVADVVEAMSSHRPYRAALGIDAALDEIAAGRKTRYYPDVVDACIAVFRDNGFTFSA